MQPKKLIIEEKAEQLVEEVANICRTLRYQCKASKDAMNSADSVLLSIGEGIPIFQPKMKATKYNVARGEAGEVKRALIALVKKRRVKPEQIEVAYKLADELCAMLTTMIKNLEERF